MRIYLLGMVFALLAFAPASKKTGKVKGNDSFLKKNVTVFIEMDYSKTSLDGLDSEEEFIEYKRSKKKDKKDADKWEADWKKDTEGILEYYQEYLDKKCKKYPATFNIDDPDSDYKMVVQPIHIQTGTPVKKSSIETKLIFYKMDTNEEVATIYVAESDGVQMGPMSPTTGMRVRYSFGTSAALFAKYYKGLMK